MNMIEIGIIHSCFKQKFGTPRQSGLSKNSYGTIEIFKEFSHEDIIRGLESFSHIWVLFHFHKAKTWNPTVRPPRLGGKEKVGVFASRSPFRPNAVGMSVLKIKDTKRKDGQIFIDVSGLDILDKTPLLDIKPYIPLIDSIPDAKSGWAIGEFSKIENITFSPGLKVKNPELIKEVISLDPRPAHQKSLDKTYKLKIGEQDIHWRVIKNQVEVFKII
ncbi:MAG: tRNA (N6-threonylcarbamoyladenosine(37)-N6)-methyltransferase TrmO [Bacteriovoracales bacterium]